MVVDEAESRPGALAVSGRIGAHNPRGLTTLAVDLTFCQIFSSLYLKSTNQMPPLGDSSS